jgi:glycosyltransferase involved in cell wall biosynthesis
MKKRIFRQLLEIEQRFFFRLGFVSPMPCMTWHREYQRLIQKHHLELQQQTFDILWVEDVYSWPYARDLLKKLPTKPRKLLCNTYNIESQVTARTAALTNDASARKALERNRNQLASMESDAYSRSNLTIACSEEDRRNGIGLAPQGNFLVIGNGVDTSYFTAISNQETDNKKPVLLFTGTFTYGPNPQAAHYFATEILPLIHQQIPDVVFMIAGSRAAETRNQLTALGLDIACVSDPADMRPCFSKASLFVVPIQTGGGTRLKILEAMAMGVPVVSTSIGAEGLGAQHGTHLFIGDSPQEFAQRCVDLLRDDESQRRLVRNALEWVREKYDWQRLCQLTKIEVESLLNA